MFIKSKKNESGDIIILFAGTLILLIVFLGLSTDVILAFNKRDRLIEIGNLMKDARFDLGEELWNSNYPESTLREITLDIAAKNGLNSEQVDVKWIPTRENETLRAADVKITLTDKYECTVLKMLGINELPIKVKIDGEQFKSGTRIWSPRW